MKESFKKEFGKKVKYYRKLKGLSQEKLAEMVGISSHTVGYIERGKNLISMTKLPNLAYALGVDIYRLFADENLENNEEKIEKISNILKVLDEKRLNLIINIINNIADI